MQKQLCQLLAAAILLTVTALPAVAENDGSHRARLLKAGIDQFTLKLHYLGDAQNTYCNMTLSVPSPGKPENAFDQRAVLSTDQAVKIIDHLQATGALAVMLTGDDVKNVKKPCYLLAVGNGTQMIGGSIGWGPNTLKVLDSLRGVLDGNARKALDQVLSRLAGERKQWK